MKKWTAEPAAWRKWKEGNCVRRASGTGQAGGTRGHGAFEK